MLRFLLMIPSILLLSGVRPVMAQSVPILSVTFEGNRSVDATRLKTQLRSSRDGGWYHPETFKAELQALERFYQDEGFLRARIGPPSVEFQTLPGRGQVASIRIPISEGARYVMGDLVIRNAHAIKPAALLQLSPLRTGQPYSRTKMQQFQQKIEENYYSLGYIRFEASVQEVIHDFKKVVDCVLECKEGKSYRVRTISTIGDESINISELKKQILLAEGSAYNPELLSLSIAFLNSLRTYHPISESNVEVRIDDAQTCVDLVFHLVRFKKTSSSSSE